MADALDAIAAEGAAAEAGMGGGGVPGDPGAPGVAAPGSEPGKMAPAELWAMVPATLGSVLGMAIPELKQTYTPEACNAWGVAMAAVAEKRGWNVTQDTPEVLLIFATAPLAIPTFTALVNRGRAARQARATAAPAGDASAGTGDQAPLPANVTRLP